jgi:hypothetical protein
VNQVTYCWTSVAIAGLIYEVVWLVKLWSLTPYYTSETILKESNYIMRMSCLVDSGGMKRLISSLNIKCVKSVFKLQDDVFPWTYSASSFTLLQIERPLQKHGGRLDHNEVYCGSCYGAEEVHIYDNISLLWFGFYILFMSTLFCYMVYLQSINTNKFLLMNECIIQEVLTWHLQLYQSDDQCCNTCEEVRDAYRKKGWALTNVQSIDQVWHANIISLQSF